MDAILEKEIQNLIDNHKGDAGRLEFILSSIQNNKELYNSDQKFLVNLLEKHSYDPHIFQHLKFFNPKIIEKKVNITTFADNIDDSYIFKDKIHEHISSTPKNKRNATILAVVLGIMGIGGIGHLYIGKTGRGLGILFSIIAIFLTSFVAFSFFEFLPVLDITWNMPPIFSFIGLIPFSLFVINTAIFIWQIFDVRKLCKKYNVHFENTQENLW